MAEIMDRIPCHEVEIVEPNGVAKIVKVPVIQELSKRCDSLFPERFTRTPDASLPTSFPVPVIDLAKFQAGGDPEAREMELQKLRHAAREWGMFVVENHGIEPDVLEGFKNVVKEFFRLPFDEKKASVGSYDNPANTGYGRNYIIPDLPLDWHDRLSIRPFPVDATDGLRVWPSIPPNFREAAEDYVNSSRKMCDVLLQALAESLSADKNAFLKYFDEKRSTLQVKSRSSSGGLQTYSSKDDKWVTIEWPVDGILVNVGDLLQIMSNGEFESPWHRVAAQGVERYSVAMFYAPPTEAEIGPYTDPEKSSYRKLTVDDYINNFYKANPTLIKETVKYAQIKIDDIPADVPADIPAAAN